MDKNIALSIAFSILFSISAWAAIPVHQANGEKQNQYIDNGVFVGGRDHGPLTLLNVRHSLKGKIERLVFDLGQKGVVGGVERPGFFHISIQTKPQRIVIDLENVTNTKVTAQQISHLFSKSPYLSKISLFEDSFHQNMTIELPLKSPAQMEVFELVTAGKPGRIVLDITSL